ncbi:MAG: hypothetical protein HY788_01615 [Deltaproteobacteria bacterium]|nr:hypothetical protein [Deltaproteobacteria bacterium]
MYKLFLLIAATALLFPYPLWAQLPDAPANVTPVRIERFGDVADLFVWTQDGKMYVRYEIVTGDDYFACPSSFNVIQSDTTGGFDGGSNRIYREEGGESVCESITADETFLVIPSAGDEVDLSQPVEVYFNAEKVVLIHVFPGGASIIPTNGIWQSSDPPLSIYIQKYQAASAIAVATQDGVNLVAFLDSNIADGFSQANDVGNQGFGININFQDSTHGTVTVDLPSGAVTADIALTFPDLR